MNKTTNPTPGTTREKKKHPPDPTRKKQHVIKWGVRWFNRSLSSEWGEWTVGYVFFFLEGRFVLHFKTSVHDQYILHLIPSLKQTVRTCKLGQACPKREAGSSLSPNIFQGRKAVSFRDCKSWTLNLLQSFLKGCSSWWFQPIWKNSESTG